MEPVKFEIFNNGHIEVRAIRVPDKVTDDPESMVAHGMFAAAMTDVPHLTFNVASNSGNIELSHGKLTHSFQNGDWIILYSEKGTPFSMTDERFCQTFKKGVLPVE